MFDFTKIKNEYTETKDKSKLLDIRKKLLSDPKFTNLLQVESLLSNKYDQIRKHLHQVTDDKKAVRKVMCNTLREVMRDLFMKNEDLTRFYVIENILDGYNHPALFTDDNTFEALYKLNKLKYLTSK